MSKDLTFVIPAKSEDTNQTRVESQELIKSLARTTARAAHKLGIQFDVNDPQVVRDLVTTAFTAVSDAVATCEK